MNSNIIEILRRIPLFLYAISFVAVLVFFFSLEKTGVGDLDQFVYRNSEGACQPVIALLNYDHHPDYHQLIDSLERADSVKKPYFKFKANAKVKVLYAKKDLYRIHFLKNNEIADGFILKEYVHNDSCFITAR